MAQLYAKKIGIYKLQKVIGKGSFATVYRGENEETHQIVAIKMIETKNIDQEKIEAIEKEIAVLQSLKHPNIVEFLDLRKTKNHWYLIFEYCEMGDLEKYVRSNYVVDAKINKFRVPEEIVKKIMSQLIGAFQLMKEKNIVHRDLKLANILVAKDFNVKLADFGFAKFAEQNTLLTSYCGTPITMAPEILTRQKYTEKCDIWSLGVIIYQMLFGFYPFYPPKGGNIDDLIKVIQTQPLNFKTNYEMEISQEAQQLLRLMLRVDQSQRISFDDFFKHQWIKSIQGKQLEKELQSAYQSTQIQKLIHKQTMESQQNIQMQKEQNLQKTNEKEKKKDLFVVNNSNNDQYNNTQQNINNYYLFYKMIENLIDNELFDIIEKQHKIQETIKLFSQVKSFEPEVIKLCIYLLLLNGLELIKDALTKRLRISYDQDDEYCTINDIFQKLKFGLEKEKLLKEKYKEMYQQLESIEIENKAIIEQYKTSDFNKYSCEEMIYKVLLELSEASILNECAKLVDNSTISQNYQLLLSICEILKLQVFYDYYEIRIEHRFENFDIQLSKFVQFEQFWKEKDFGQKGFVWKSENGIPLPELRFERKFEASAKGCRRKMNEAGILIEIFMKRLEDIQNEL